MDAQGAQPMSDWLIWEEWNAHGELVERRRFHNTYCASYDHWEYLDRSQRTFVATHRILQGGTVLWEWQVDAQGRGWPTDLGLENATPEGRALLASLAQAGGDADSDS